MTHAASSNAPKTSPVQALPANEWGQISGLEPNATYFVIRKPTADYTRERSREMLQEMRAFLHEQRVLTEKQMQELNDRYGQPAKAKAMEIRETLEKRFDEIAKEVEARFERLESELGDRAPGIFKGRKDKASAPSGGAETPGEMPMGEHAPPPPSEPAGDASGAPGSGPVGSKPRKNPRRPE